MFERVKAWLRPSSKSDVRPDGLPDKEGTAVPERTGKIRQAAGGILAEAVAPRPAVSAAQPVPRGHVEGEEWLGLLYGDVVHAARQLLRHSQINQIQEKDSQIFSSSHPRFYSDYIGLPSREQIRYALEKFEQVGKEATTSESDVKVLVEDLFLALEKLAALQETKDKGTVSISHDAVQTLSLLRRFMEERLGYKTISHDKFQQYEPREVQDINPSRVSHTGNVTLYRPAFIDSKSGRVRLSAMVMMKE